jgi:hypothetical protein
MEHLPTSRGGGEIVISLPKSPLPLDLLTPSPPNNDLCAVGKTGKTQTPARM